MRKYFAALILLSVMLTGCSSDEPVSHVHESIPLSELMGQASSEVTSSEVSEPVSEEVSSEAVSSEAVSSEEVSSETESSVSSTQNELSANEGDIVLKPAAVSFTEPKLGDWNMILVNAINPLAEDYALNLTSYNEYYQVDARILEPLNAMMKAAANDGVSIYPCSAYRTRERSAYLYEQQVQKFLNQGYSDEDAKVLASHWVAPPGTSEHHTGLALDFVSNESTELNKSFADTKAAKWLLENAESYGFILRYPEGKEDITGIVFEPWHYRFVGVETAAYIMQKGLTFEEYLGAEAVGYEEIE